jgi:selenocysteine lyase/cysteine desulfurase
MNASLGLIHELGPDAVSKHALDLAEMIVRWSADRDDVELVTPADPSYRGAVVSVRPAAAKAVSERLAAANVVHSLREGAIRLSPHFYNTPDEIQRALDLIAR